MQSAAQLEYVSRAMADKGWAVLEDVFPEAALANVLNEIKHLVASDDVDLYHDADGQLRRMEQFTRRSTTFTQMNDAVLALLHETLSESFSLFKDKYNFKPPGGEGFFPHYDGIFRFPSSDGRIKDGWYEYAPEFISVLVAVDAFTPYNGALEIAPADSGDFESLLARTLADGTPHLLPSYAEKLQFEQIAIRRGGIAIFRHTCPHRSGVNRSTDPRGSIYWTYNPSRYGNHYEQYFIDKRGSTSPSKALSGDRFEG